MCRRLLSNLLYTVAFTLVLAACGETSTSSPLAEKQSTELTPKEIFSGWMKGAEQGNAEAQYWVGVMYAKGEGVTTDLVKATDWYRRAAEQGYAQAQFALGVMYDHGQGVAMDPTKAVEWYRKAADQGLAAAQFNLGLCYSEGTGVGQNSAKAVEWYQKAAEQGHADAQNNLANKYAIGDGVAKDPAKATEWFRRAAEQGSSNAQATLGSRYISGYGVPKDAVKATEWFRRAAEQGHTNAQNTLGVHYAQGTGVPKDLVLAYVWFNLSAAAGSQAAVGNRDRAEGLLSKTEMEEGQRLSSAWKTGQSIVREGNRVTPTPQNSSTNTLAKQGTGTMFMVGKTGQAITNQHVVQGCTELRIEGREGIAKLITDDKANDLALLQIPGEAKATALVSEDPAKLRQGEDIVVFGFPLNAVLSSGGNLTLGIVSALTGLGNNTNQIQITAPIQPGSSGSPVMNKKGEIVGVVSMKLSDSKMAKTTGSVGQNVNFAVSGQTLKAFLDAHKIPYRVGGMLSFEKNTADLADDARKWTFVVECWK